MMARSGVRTLVVIATLVMIAAVVAGLYVLGSPAHQRLLKLDARRTNDLTRLTYMIASYRQRYGSLPPGLASLDMSDDVSKDPVTGITYDYHATGTDTYQLCATFDAPSEPNTAPATSFTVADNMPRWPHPTGKHCFERVAKIGANTFY